MSKKLDYTDCEPVDLFKSHVLSEELSKRVSDRADDLVKNKTRTNKFDGNILNVRPDPPDFRDRVYQSSLQEIKSYLIPELDPPTITGEVSYSNGVAVRDQGSEGSCTGQALAAVIDFQNKKRKLDGADVPNNVSARMLYEEAREYDEYPCLLYTSPSPRDRTRSRMPSSA